MRLLMMSAVLLLVTASAGEAMDRVWSGHAVRFAFEADANAVFVAYYDADRQLSVASRPRH